MPSFTFRARANGEEITGVRQSGSAAQLAAELSGSGMVPLSINESTSGGEETTGFEFSFGRRVSLPEIVMFSHQMASLTKAGISVVRAVKTLSESTRNAYLREVLTQVANDLEGGLDMASCLRRHAIFNDIYVSTIHIGENTGRMDEAFKRIAEYLELERETKRRINAATRYPSFVLGAMGIAISRIAAESVRLQPQPTENAKPAH